MALGVKDAACWRTLLSIHSVGGVRRRRKPGHKARAKTFQATTEYSPILIEPLRNDMNAKGAIKVAD
jgi:hypothetical protein